jgi:Zn-dependent M28 family amino/carboxypeptidase
MIPGPLRRASADLTTGRDRTVSTRRTLATVVVSAALGLGAAPPAHAVLVPDPGPPAATEAAPDNEGASTPETPGQPAAPVETREVLRHLEAFQSISEANGGTRAVGTAGHEASGRYVEEQLTAAGYEPWRQYFPFVYEETLSTSLTYTRGERTTAAAHVPMAQSPGTPEGAVTGAVVTPTGSFAGCAAQDWADVDATGGVALVVRGSCTFADKARTAADAGAAALIVHNNDPAPLNGTLGGHPDEHIPTVGVSEETGRALSALPDDATVTLMIDKVIEERQTFTVLAQTDRAPDDSVVMVGAHLDGGEEGPGINDNGTGSAALLETATQLARDGQTTRAVRFAWWGASDIGNLGSRHYVTELAEDDPDGLGDIKAYLDVDTVASPNHIVAVHDADGGPGSVLGDHLDSIGQPWVDVAAPPESDLRVFMEAGVPSTGLSTGTSGSKTAQEGEVFGGTVGLPYDPNHDTVADDLDNVDVDVLQVTTAAVAHAAKALATRS